MWRYGARSVALAIVTGSVTGYLIWRFSTLRDDRGPGASGESLERRRVEAELRYRIEQLDALARLGQYALVEPELEKLFDRAVRVVARGVDADVTELLELMPGGEELLLRAGSGWPAGVVGHARARAGRDSMAGYSLLGEEPLIVEDLAEERRFKPSGFLCDARVVSGLNVIVRGRERPWGALGAHTKTPRRYSDDDIVFLQSVSNIVAQAIELRRIESGREQILEAERTAREEAEQRREEVEELIVSRARLMRGFSHDVKNPLGAADGFLQLMEEGILDELSPRQAEGVARARRSIGDALHLIEDLLTIARAEASKIKPERVKTDLLDTIRSASERAQAQARTSGLTLETVLPDALPTISSDPDRIRQILGNLLSNAVKYTERGGVTVAAREVEGGTERGRGGAPGTGHWVAIAVKDTGIGIPESDQQKIFREFRRLETEGGVDEGEEGQEGQGIGLFMAQRLAQALGGEITVESQVGEGSTFTLWLPTRRPARYGSDPV